MVGSHHATQAPRFAFVLALLIGTAVSAQPLDPLEYASLGTLHLSAGDYTIDTDTLTIIDNTAPGAPLFTGVVDDQNGQADYFGGVWAPVANPGQLGVPEIAVFTFDAIDLQPTANGTITGARALALLSRGAATIATPLSVDGGIGAASSNDTSPPIDLPGGTAGAGGFGGGAIELGAAGLLRIDATISNDGADQPGDFLLVFGGAGSGGGIRVHGQQVVLNGRLDAVGGANGLQRRPGGGGRVFVNGLGSEVYTVGQPTPDLSGTLAQIDASHGDVGNFDAGEYRWLLSFLTLPKFFTTCP